MNTAGKLVQRPNNLQSHTVKHRRKWEQHSRLPPKHTHRFLLHGPQLFLIYTWPPTTSQNWSQLSLVLLWPHTVCQTHRHFSATYDRKYYNMLCYSLSFHAFQNKHTHSFNSSVKMYNDLYNIKHARVNLNLSHATYLIPSFQTDKVFIFPDTLQVLQVNLS